MVAFGMESWKKVWGDKEFTYNEALENLRKLGYSNPFQSLNWFLKTGRIVKVNDKFKVNYSTFTKAKTIPKLEMEIVARQNLLSFEAEYIPRKIGKTTDVEIVKKAMQEGENILLVGETGTGKTHLVYYVAKMLGRKVVRVNLNRAVTPEDLVGSWQVNGEAPNEKAFKWVDGVLTRALKEGAIFMCDEINAAPPEILFILNSVLDERKLRLIQHQGELIEANKDFVFVATMNPESYEGTQKLNPALLDRFRIVLFFDYNSKIEEKLGIPNFLIKFADRIRKAYYANEVSMPISTRALLQFVKNENEFGFEVAKEMLLAKFPVNERKAIGEIFDLILTGENEKEGEKNDKE